MSSETSPPAQAQKQTHLNLDDFSAHESEFPNGRVAVGAAMTYIDDLKKALTPQKYDQIISLLNSYYTHSLKEKDVYVLVKRVLKGVEGEEGLVKGFERFLPEGVVGPESEGVKGGDVKEEGKEVKGKKVEEKEE